MNKSARLYGKCDLRLEEVPIPDLGPEDVLIQMAFVGICGSDVHLYDDGHIDRFIVSQPFTLGHELSGVVSKTGHDVTVLQAGDRVAINNMQPCFECFYCKKGRSNICSNIKAAGIPLTDGGFARYMVTPAYTCHKLPDNVSLQAGACMEPLAVVVNGLRRGNVTDGDVVAVIGAGPIGLFAMQAAKAFGGKKVIVVDINQKRLELAAKLGADLTFNSQGISDPETAAEAIRQTLGDEVDVCVECSGAPGTLDTAIHVCRIGGRVVVLGIGKMAMHVHIGKAALNEINIIGSFCNNNNFPESVDLVSSGKVNVLPVVTHFFPLDKIVDALALVRDGRSSVKVMIDCQK